MRFDNQSESGNVEDRRGAGGGGRSGFPFGGMRLPMGRGGGMHLPGGRGGLGLGGLLLLLAIAWFTGLNPFATGGGQPGHAVQSETPVRATAQEEATRSFLAKVLATTETCWHDLFAERLGARYEEPTLVLFRDGVRSACGVAGSSVGPFYCPGDGKIYVDLSFFDEMDRTLGAGGDFAQAYVIAHEVGHHVQNLLGTSRKVQSLHGRAGDAEYTRASVQLELQADYFAGVWAHYVQHRMQGHAELEIGDYEEAIAATQAVGDDTLQRRATGRVVPEKFTHGTAAQRTKWFELGFRSGDPLAHDPFVEER